MRWLKAAPLAQSRDSDFLYKGPSMYFTLKPLDRLRLRPYSGEQPVQRGDVIVFVPPGGKEEIVHRVIAVEAAGIRTRGDNNEDIDPWVLVPSCIRGRVTAVGRAERNYRIYGGQLGCAFAAYVRTVRLITKVLRKVASSLLAVFTRFFPEKKLFRLPGKMRTIVFKCSGAENELQVYIGRWRVARKLSGAGRWEISRPLRLFFKEQDLPRDPPEVQ